MNRSQYRNGDVITRRCGCNSCNPSHINGVLCHETGCPDGWRDHKIECKECGDEVYPEFRMQMYCNSCYAAFTGIE